MLSLSPLSISGVLQALEYSKDSNQISPVLQNKIAKLGKVFEQITIKYVEPTFTMSPDSIENFLLESAIPTMMDFEHVIPVFVELARDSEFKQALPSVADSLVERAESGHYVYSRESINRVIEALKLEIDNESYLLTNYGDSLSSSDMMTIFLSAFGNDTRIATVVAVQFLTMVAVLEALNENDERISRNFEVLSKLALRFTEEKDAVYFSTLELMLNEQKRKDLEDAYADFRKSAEQTA